MANNNSVLVPEIIANEALMVLERQSQMARLVNRDYENKIANAGDRVHLTLPGSFTVNAKAAGSNVTIQDAASTRVSCVLQYHDEITFLIEDKENALSITDLVRLYIEPAMIAHAAKLDDRLLGLYVDVTNNVGVAGTDANKQVIIDAAKTLNVAMAPKTGRNIVWHPKDEAALMALDLFTAASYGDEKAAKEFQLPRRFGFDHMMDQGVVQVAGSPASTKNMAFVRDAFALVTRPLPLPDAGFGVKAANVVKDGVNFRVLIAYNPDRLGVQVTIDLVYGVKTVRPELACLILT